MEIINTLCRMCSWQCGMKVYLEQGRIVGIKGEGKHPNSRGKLCAKGLSAMQLEYDPNRLTHPLKRVGERGAGEWEQITWDAALDIMKNKLEEIIDKFDAKSVAWHRGTASRWGSVWFFLKRFMNVLGSPNLATHDHICHTPRVLAHDYTYGGMPNPDYTRMRCGILWGSNPASTNVVMGMRLILDAKRNGAKLIVIDPIFTKTAAKADIHVQPRPGTDGALALGMLNIIIKGGLYDRKFVENWTVGFSELSKMIEEYTPKKVEVITGVAQDTIQRIAKIYATTKPAVLEEGNGLDQHTNVVQTTRALAILRAITGNLGIPGGHIFPSPLGLTDISLRGKIRDAYEKSVSTHPLYYNEPKIGLVSTPEIIDAILIGKPYPIKALIVQASAIGVIESNTNRVLDALRGIDFLVVHDIFMTAAAELADLVVPATTFLEQSQLVTRPGPDMESTLLGMINKTVEPLGECWSDMKFILELAKRMGYQKEFAWKNEEEVFDDELSPLGLTVEKLRIHPGGVIFRFDPAEVYKKYEREGFRTPTGKVELYSKTYEEMGYDPLPKYREPAESPYSSPDTFVKYPLICGTGLKPGVFTHTRYRTLAWLKELMPEPFVLVNPKDAEMFGIVDGDLTTVRSPRGNIKIRAHVCLSVHRGIVMISHGWGQPYVGGAITNLLTDDKHRCPISGATGNRSFLCNIISTERGGKQ